MANVTPHYSIPLDTNGIVEFKQSFVRAMSIIGAELSISLPTGTNGSEEFKQSLRSAMAQLASELSISLPINTNGVVSMKDDFVRNMKAVDTAINAQN